MEFETRMTISSSKSLANYKCILYSIINVMMGVATVN